jgi:DNA-binding Lrp family transcriptional regulator
MGRPKYYRFNIKQQINSLQYKTKFYYLKNMNISRYGLCPAEAELLADIANNYYQHKLLKIPENHFSISVHDNFKSDKKCNLNELPQKIVNIPAYSHYELEVYQDFGLKALQNYRIVNILDAIIFQDARIDMNLLAKLVNITPKSIRQRIDPLLKAGIRLPLTHISTKWDIPSRMYRYSRAIYDFFMNRVNEGKIMKNFFITKNEWSCLLFNFFQFSYGHSSLCFFPKSLADELQTIKKQVKESPRYVEYSNLFPKINAENEALLDSKHTFLNTLKQYFSFSNALAADYLNFIEQEAANINQHRKQGEIIYYAVSANTIAGTQLIQSDFVPIKLTIFAEDDKLPVSAYETKTRKWNKAARYSIQAQHQTANLSQYDLAYLLGISLSVIKKLMQQHNNNILPTRGNIHDIGPGVSHAEKIINLYLQGYTETEIKLKTGHSYESIENYLRHFTKVVGLTDLGLNLHQLRMTAKITFNLAKKFYDIYKKHDTPEYTWIMAKIRNDFNHTIKKNNHGETCYE